jgi:hypothetical protein
MIEKASNGQSERHEIKTVKELTVDCGQITWERFGRKSESTFSHYPERVQIRELLKDLSRAQESLSSITHAPEKPAPNPSDFAKNRLRVVTAGTFAVSSVGLLVGTAFTFNSALAYAENSIGTLVANGSFILPLSLATAAFLSSVIAFRFFKGQKN